MAYYTREVITNDLGQSVSNQLNEIVDAPRLCNSSHSPSGQSLLIGAPLASGYTSLITMSPVAVEVFDFRLSRVLGKASETKGHTGFVERVKETFSP